MVQVDVKSNGKTRVIPDPSTGEQRYKSFTDHCDMLRDAGEERGATLTHLLLEQGVLGLDGKVYSPTRTAVLELLKWHAGGGPLVAVPMAKLAMELGCGEDLVRDLLKQLEDEGLVLRHRRRAPGNLYTTEIVGPSPEPDATPLTPTQEHLLSVLVSQSDVDGLVQTNEHEMALAVDVSHETVLHSLISLRRLGYVSATFAEYGRPCIVKVLYDRPVSSKEVSSGNGVAESVQTGYCLSCRDHRRVLDARVEEVKMGGSGVRSFVRGVCEVCGGKVHSLIPTSERGSQEPVEDRGDQEIYDRPVPSKASPGNGVLTGRCPKCRKQRQMVAPQIKEANRGGRGGNRVYAVGACEVCGTKVCCFISRQKLKASQEQESDQNGQLVRFLQWQRDLRQQEQDKLDELIGEFSRQ